MTDAKQKPEVWLRGPLPDVPPLLQPVAHALLQAVEDVERMVEPLSRRELWSPAGSAATVAFHMRHMTGSLDRLTTYARGEALSAAQMKRLADEKRDAPDLTSSSLVDEFRATVTSVLAQLRATDVATLTDHRAVGRAALPSTVIGLLVHAAEHTTRHAGQISTTIRVLGGAGAEGA